MNLKSTSLVTTPFAKLLGLALVLLGLAPPVHSQTADSFNPGANASVYSLSVQADGKILVGGYFTKLGGQTRNYLGRLSTDGTLDSTFNPGANSYVDSLAVQADGKILVGGGFTTLGGQTRNRIGRLNADGTLDSTFNPGASGGYGPFVSSLAVQANGKILVGGNFTMLSGQSRTNIGRLNADGTLDNTFNPGANASVYSLAMQADGKIVVGGGFTKLGGQTRNYLGRLNANGTLDSTFNPGANDSVYSLAVQADGKIVVGGYFWTLGGQTCYQIGRLDADGTLDSTFNPRTDDGVYSLAVQADGKIVVGGYFTRLCGQTCNRIGRLNADGTLDSTFNPGADDGVNSLAVQADGKIVVGGYLTTLAGQSRSKLGRLNNTEPATQSLSRDDSTITWLRGGTSPEVWRTTFDHSGDGVNWTNLGAGTRISGGWQLAEVSLSPGSMVRARGYVTGGQYNASGWFVEAYLGAPVFFTQPASRTNDAGETATFSVLVGGTEPFGYQWLRNGAAMADGGNILGAFTPTLTMSSISESSAGSYSVVVTNAQGSVTSAVAVLTVLPAERFVSVGLQSDGRLRTTIVGRTERVFTLQGTPDLFHWADLGRYTNQTGELVLTNVSLAGRNAYFYRTVFRPGTNPPAVAAPVLSGMALLPDGRVRFQLDSTAGTVWRAEGSPDLIHWGNYGVVTNPSGRLVVTNTPVARPRVYFYRVAQP